MKKYKHNRKLITLNCDNCNEEYQKPITEYNRNVKLGRRNYCCRSCVGKSKKNLENLSKFRKLFGYDISQHAGSSPDKYTPFRYYLKNSRNRFKEINITLDDLKNKWEEQLGICPYSGIKLTLNTHSHIINDTIYSASLDRINSDEGYIKNNIQFVSRAINYMKSTMSHDDTIKMCKLIANNYN